ncbi:primary replicative DNA helicase [Fluviicoccus keumensis]|uniref:Replicative DNA helicase n=1 Tax=Fluviicoccus keumensis TaxID=1435465 RepID=A0A4Q7Z917_9GAMM|nr:replicative DNA helicase [Fluviicoccus keumensis]RZU46978.1 primary replicative DNA helicase [Fluviicoccus keumensis]
MPPSLPAESDVVTSLKVPPHSLTLEQAILSGLMADPSAWDNVTEIVSEKDFYSPRHSLIFRAIATLINNDQPCDAILVMKWLEDMQLLEKAGGESYLGQILKDAPATTANIEAYSERVREFSVLRQLIATSGEIANVAYQPKGQSAATILDQAETKIFAIAEQQKNRDAKSGPQLIKPLLAKTLEKIDELYHSTEPITGLTTGFSDLDNRTFGMQKSDLIIVAARPSMGKTTFAMNLVESVIFNSDLPAVVFSMEMPAEQLLLRMLSSIGGVDQSRVRSGKLEEDDWPRLASAVTQLSDKKLYIDDSAALPPNEVRARARRVARDHGGKMGLVMVDYLQLMRVPGMENNRVNEVGEISRSMKALAKELQCPVVALSQLSRNLEQRPNKRPVMSDLRESGAIEQDADLIMFIYRDEVYNTDSKDKGTAEIIIAKQRNGPIGTARLAFVGHLSRFKDLAPEYYRADDE